MRVFEKVAATLLSLAILSFPFYAHASTASANLPIQVTKPAAGVACDFGPNYAGAIPAAAQAAGFTHCAANYDFTSAAYANPATWLDCAGATGSQIQFTLYGNTCSHVFITTDGGSQVLNIQWNQNTDLTPAYGSMNIQTAGSNNDPNIADAILSMPTGKYIEYVVKTDPNTQQHAGCTSCFMNDVWSWGGNGNPNFVEWDFLEEYDATNANGGIWHGWDGANIGVSPMREPGMESGYDPTVYNTYGMRIANDTSGNVAVCNYLNGNLLDSTLQGSSDKCATGSYSPVPVGRDFLVLTSGPEDPTGAKSYAVLGNFYIKSVRIWECSGYKTGECYNSTAQVSSGGALAGSP